MQPESAGLDVHRFPVAVAVTDEVTVTLGYPAGAFVTADALEGYVPLGEDGKVPGEYLPEMDYDPSGTAAAAVQAHNQDAGAHPAIQAAMMGASVQVSYNQGGAA